MTSSRFSPDVPTLRRVKACLSQAGSDDPSLVTSDLKAKNLRPASPCVTLQPSFLVMARMHKLLEQILRGDADANIPFSGMVQLLQRLGFQERVKGSHHIFFREGAGDLEFAAAREQVQTLSGETGPQCYNCESVGRRSR